MLTGTGFSTDLQDNMITIADIKCEVTEATETSIACTLGNGPEGTHDVVLTVAGKGLANNTVSVQFTYSAAAITGIMPETGSTGGKCFQN